MSAATCPDNETLKSLLLGKLAGSQVSQWEEHLLRCESCASKAETIDGHDALTEAIAHGNFPSGDEEVLSAAIEQAKRLISGLETIKTDETLTGENPLSQASSFESEHSRYKLDFLAPAEQPDELGRLGDYRVLKVLGVGGMGMVFKGEDIRLGRLVALKVMRPGIAAKPDAKARFLREAKATASLSHDHIVQIYQVGEHDGVPFIAMQYLAGESLETRLKRVGKLPDAEVIRIGKEVALGLAAAHEAGMIHRDIKPDNVWMELKTDRAKILDFGLVRDDHSDQGLTQSGTILGTPRYMAPEQVAGDKVDHRSDLFSLGSMLYHLAAGRPAFIAPTIPSLLYAIAHSTPQPLADSSPQTNPALADLIMRLLSKSPEHRPQSAAEVAKQFARIESAMKLPADNAVLPVPSSITTTATSSANRRPPTRP
jgi:serine/threonine protein kinase